MITKRLRFSKRRLMVMLLGTFGIIGAGASFVQLFGADPSPLGCADYVCSFNQQCTKVSGCKSCSGIRCSDTD